VSRRCLYFRRGEQMRLCLAALREAGKPISCRAVAKHAMEAKGLSPELPAREVITEHIRSTLYRLERKGIVRKLVDWPETWWELVG